MPKPVTCVMCQLPPVEAFKPFCSKRCADLDLGKWFTGAYAIPGEPADQAVETPGDSRRDSGEDDGRG